MARVPIRPVLEHYGAPDLPEAQRWRPVSCVFHDDRTASASYIANGEDAEAFNCHSCGMRGDAIALVRTKEGLSYTEALEFLAGLTGTTYTPGAPTPPKRYKPVRLGQPTTPTPQVSATRRRRALRLRED